MAVFGNIGSFNEKVELFQDFTNRCDTFLAANRIYEELQVGLFLVVVGADAFKLVKNLCHPTMANLKTYAQLKALTEHDTLKCSLCLRKDCLEPHPLPPIHSLNNPLEEVLSFKLLGLTICHDLSWESHISNLASKASRRLGILHRAKSFLDPLELLTTYKACVRSLMEYCSSLGAGAPASHLSRFHAVETKAFRIIGISCNEAESLGLSLSHRRLVGGLSVFYHLLSSLAPLCSLSAICPHHISTGCSRSANNPLLVKLPKSRGGGGGGGGGG
uniref:Uncharacterized protein n=1 Tax=Eptatretus burgeri TaxID=7764 RepID=A0A8C4Q6J1_EPTBU